MDSNKIQSISGENQSIINAKSSIGDAYDVLDRQTSKLWAIHTMLCKAGGDKVTDGYALLLADHLEELDVAKKALSEGFEELQ